MLPGMLLGTFPRVKSQLQEYRRRLKKTGGALAEQGLASIRHKEFHCLGGSAYALLAPPERRGAVLEFIVAFQTISDYLDNLCDRAGVREEKAFRQLHRAMLEAIEPWKKPGGGYYEAYPQQNDGGYLQRLVRDCRRALREIPGWQPRRAQLSVELYTDLQSYKHVELSRGEDLLRRWHCRHKRLAPALYWWEFAAAAGSTLEVFALAAEPAAGGELETAYMPWVKALHILLDYYIDQAEDKQHGDLNLVSYYRDREMLKRRIDIIYHRAKEEVQKLANPAFHTMVLDGLLGLYLSDPKAHAPQLAGQTSKLLGMSRRGLMLAALGRLMRKTGWLS